MLKRLLIIILLALTSFVSGLSPDKVSVSMTSFAIEDDYYKCKVKIQLPVGWKMYGNAKISSTSGVEGITTGEIYKPTSNTYKTTISVPTTLSGNCELKAEFAACSDKMCSFVEKTFTLNLDSKEGKTSPPLIYIVLLALLGGLILNGMPCVLPVLSLKMHSLLKNPDRNNLLYTWIGIMISFAIFTAAMVILKMLGHKIGWGMHFQNVHFLNISALFVFIFVLSVYEKFNFMVSINDDSTSGKSEIVKNISSGIMATLLAIPCTAPFLGTAAAVAVEAKPITMSTIFMAIGFGFGLPYLLLYLFDIKIKIKPGKWTVALKHILGLGIIATFAWLIWLLSNHLNTYQLIACAVAYLVLFISINKSKVFSLLACIAIMSTPLFMNNDAKKQSLETRSAMWEKFDPIKLQKYIADGKVIFINVTADWCMTCKYNKSMLLDTQEFKDLLQKHNAIFMEGDITYQDEIVMLFLKLHKQSGIPFNVVFGPNAKTGIKLGVIPTLDEVDKALIEAVKE